MQYLTLILTSFAFLIDDYPFEIRLLIYCAEVVVWFHENFHKT